MHIFYNIKLHFLDNYDKFIKGDRYINKKYLIRIIILYNINLAHFLSKLHVDIGMNQKEVVTKFVFVIIKSIIIFRSIVQHRCIVSTNIFSVLSRRRGQRSGSRETCVRLEE